MGEYDETGETETGDDLFSDMFGDRSVAEAGEYLDEDIVTYENGDRTVFAGTKTPSAFIASDYTVDVER